MKASKQKRQVFTKTAFKTRSQVFAINICQQIPRQRNLHLPAIAHNINIITEMSNTKNL